MSFSKIKLFKEKVSVADAEWSLLTFDDNSQRFADYLYQKYQIPNILVPYLLFNGITIEKFDDYFSPKLKNLLPEPFFI
ncbi:hypothetical protein OAI36_01165 [Alphaproteobacteria bacterium]|nr:hypothetical protein [Alphaproteobacteria bacterium]